jgi:hypothetical protein
VVVDRAGVEAAFWAVAALGVAAVGMTAVVLSMGAVGVSQRPEPGD